MYRSDITLARFSDDSSSAKKAEPALGYPSMALLYGTQHVHHLISHNCIEPLGYYRLQAAVFETLLAFDVVIHQARRSDAKSARLLPWQEYENFFRLRALGLWMADENLHWRIPADQLPLDLRLNLKGLEHM